MAAPPYMKLYVADYLGDTHHLGALEHGAYLLLLMAMWRAGGVLPAHDANLAKLARCTPDQWAEIRAVVLPFFKVSRGRLRHKRLAAEIAKYESTSCKRSEAGRLGGRRKASENNAPVEANAKPPESNSRHNQNQNQNHKEKQVSLSAGAQKPARGSRISADWKPSDADRAFAQGLGLTPHAIERTAERFRDYWLGATGANASKADWPATWRNWVRREAKDLEPVAKPKFPGVF
jgi:uncharacterized protein YdaU (DUF1376 family)